MYHGWYTLLTRMSCAFPGHVIDMNGMLLCDVQRVLDSAHVMSICHIMSCYSS